MSQDEQDDEPQGLERVPDPFVAELTRDLPPADAPSPKQRRIAAAIARINAGEKLYLVAKDMGIAYGTLWRYHHGVSTLDKTREGDANRAEAIVRDLAIAGTIKASQNLLERLEDGTMRAAEEVKAMQTFRDTAAMLMGWKDSAGGDQQANPLVEFLKQHRVTVEGKRPGDDAVDVTPKGDS